MPDLYVIAGPNGAGKSTYSSQLIDPGLEIFDGDKELARLEKKLPDIDTAQLQAYISDDLFEEKKAAAIKAGKDFAYETNFATPEAINTPEQFRKAGYTIKLIYIGLPTEKTALERVSFRAKLGGHNVETEQVLSNYKEGLKNVEKYLKYFDKTRVYNNVPSQEIQKPKLIYKLEKGVILQQNKTIPKWARHLPVETPEPELKNEIKTGKRLK